MWICVVLINYESDNFRLTLLSRNNKCYSKLILFDHLPAKNIRKKSCYIFISYDKYFPHEKIVEKGIFLNLN